jgi:hypothetical protein
METMQEQRDRADGATYLEDENAIVVHRLSEEATGHGGDGRQQDREATEETAGGGITAARSWRRRHATEEMSC